MADLIAGIAYFKDGHSEVISSWQRFGTGGAIRFAIGALVCYYLPTVITLQSGYRCVRHMFRSGPDGAELPIERIVLL